MTKFELIIPSDKRDVFEKCLDIVKGKDVSWAYALHPVDELSSFEHFHLGVFLKSSRTLDDLVSWFKDTGYVKSNSIQKIKSHSNTYLCYIQHKTKDAIREGKSAPTEFSCSKDLDFDKAVSEYNSHIDIDHIVDLIMLGELRECDVWGNTDMAKFLIKGNHTRTVDNAFKAFYKSMQLSANRKREVNDNMDRKQFWIYGEPGIGKTELAKYLCSQCGYGEKDIYVTSSGSNPFDDYMGQRCVIIDDIGAETMSPKTALKLLDLFTSSAVGARYYNKIIAAECYIVTSTVEPFQWWKNSAVSSDGNVKQLLRRLNGGVYYLTRTSMTVYAYDKQGSPSGSMMVEVPAEVIEKVKNAGSNSAFDFAKAHFKLLGKEADITVRDVKTNSDGSVSFGSAEFKPVSSTPFDVNKGVQMTIEDIDWDNPDSDD